MQYQRNAQSCAAAALQNALRVLGVRVGQHRLAKLIGVTDEGADEMDILQALEELGCRVAVFESDRRQDADRWLKEMGYQGPLILCVDNWGHWVSVAGGCSERYWLFDPSTAPWNAAENGCWPLLSKTITKRWRAARRLRKDGHLYYGVSVLSCSLPKAKKQ